MLSIPPDVICSKRKPELNRHAQRVTHAIESGIADHAGSIAELIGAGIESLARPPPMKTHLLDLLFLPQKKQFDLPGTHAYIYVKSPKSVKTDSGEKQAIHLMALSQREFDEYIDLLKNDLEIIRAKAHREFAADGKRIWPTQD